MAEVQYYSTKLRKKAPILQEKQRKLVEVVVDIEEEYQKVNLQRERLKREEIEVIATVNEAIQLEMEAQEALDKIVPCITEAINSMQQISKYDMSEVKTLDHPPRTIKLVMKAVCVLLKVEPIEKARESAYKW